MRADLVSLAADLIERGEAFSGPGGYRVRLEARLVNGDGRHGDSMRRRAAARGRDRTACEEQKQAKSGYARDAVHVSY